MRGRRTRADVQFLNQLLLERQRQPLPHCRLRLLSMLPLQLPPGRLELLLQRWARAVPQRDLPSCLEQNQLFHLQCQGQLPAEPSDCSVQLNRRRLRQPLPPDPLVPYNGETKHSERGKAGSGAYVTQVCDKPSKTQKEINTADNQRKPGANRTTTVCHTLG